jgi:hypothetical protein
MTTARDQIQGALRLIGQLAEGEVPSAETAEDALTALQQMLDSWSIERLSVFTTKDQVFSWPADTASQTIGPTGDFVGARPIALQDSTYFVDQATGLSYPISQINEQQYNAISLKTVNTTYPTVMWYEASMPDARATVFPIPNTTLDFHFVSVQELTQPANLSTVLLFPPGYLRAFRYNLALEIAPEFGASPSQEVKRIAAVSKRNLKRINDPKDLMVMPAGVLGGGDARYNIYSDTVR